MDGHHVGIAVDVSLIVPTHIDASATEADRLYETKRRPQSKLLSVQFCLLTCVEDEAGEFATGSAARVHDVGIVFIAKHESDDFF